MSVVKEKSIGYTVRPGYKQTDVGLIPEHWDFDVLGCFWTVTDCKHVTAKFVFQGYPVASIREVQSKFVNLVNANCTTMLFYNQLIEGGRKPRTGDLILSRNATVGEVAQVAEWHPPFAMGQDVCLLRKKSLHHSTEFLQAVFQSRIIAAQLANLMVGSTFKRANVEQIRNFAVPMPPPSEQRLIASALSDVDGLLGVLERMITKKRDLKQAAMQQLLTGQTRLPGFTGEWREQTLGPSALLKARIGWQGLTTAEYLESGDYRLVTGTDFKDGYVDWANCHYVEYERYKQDRFIQLQTEDVLVTKDGTIGKVALVDRVDIPATLNSGVFVIRPKNEAFVPKFFYFLMCSRVFDAFLNQLAAGSTINHLYQKDFVHFKYELPPTHDEQTAIAEVLSDMDAEIAALEQRRDKTRDLKQGMMQELLTGKTRLC